MARKSRRAKAAGIVALALLIGALGIISFVRRIDAGSPGIGVQWVQSSEGPVALVVEEAGPAHRAGVEPGDILISVDGQPPGTALDAGSQSSESARPVWLQSRCRNRLPASALYSRPPRTLGQRKAMKQPETKNASPTSARYP